MRRGDPKIADRATEILGEVNESRYQEAFDMMSIETVSEVVDISTAGIVQYLMLFDKWLDIKESTSDAAKKAIDAFSIFESFNVSDPETGALINAKLGTMMDELMATTPPLINATDKAAVLAMGIKTSPAYPGLKVGHVKMSLRERGEGSI